MNENWSSKVKYHFISFFYPNLLIILSLYEIISLSHLTIFFVPIPYFYYTIFFYVKKILGLLRRNAEWHPATIFGEKNGFSGYPNISNFSSFFFGDDNNLAKKIKIFLKSLASAPNFHFRASSKSITVPPPSVLAWR